MLYFVFSDKQDLHLEEKLVSNIEASSIDKITIRRNHAEEIKIHKEKDHWFITSPLKHRASTERIDTILRVLSSKSFAKYIA